jgi:hypothetical protein
MTTDLHLLPLHRRGGEDTTDPLPGLHLASPPRKAARSRQSDQLILHLTFTGTATLNTDIQDQLLKRLTEAYYQTSGAATSALRALVESLNTFLLDRNLRAEGKGLQTTGFLTAIVLRQDQLLIAQSGLTHVFAVEETQYQHFYDPQAAGHGLGLGRVAGLLINYLTPKPGTLLLVSPAPPTAWNNPALQSAFGRPLKTVQRGLLKPAGPDLNALLVQLQTGTGKVHLHKTPPLEAVSSKPLPVTSEQVAGIGNKVPVPVVSEPVHETISSADVDLRAESDPRPEESQLEPQESSVGTTEAVALVQSESQPEQEPINSEQLSGSSILPVAQSQDRPPTSQLLNATPNLQSSSPAASKGQARNTQSEKRVSPTSKRLPTRQLSTALQSQIGPALLTIGRATREAFRQIVYTLRSLLTRLLPGSELFTIPSSTMAFIAIAVPIVLVTIAFFVYQQRGRSVQYTANLQYAEAAKTNAEGKTTPEDLRTAWNAVIFYLNQAEQYQTTAQTTGLRLEAQGILDQLDATTRLEFIPVLQTPLADNVTISRMAATADNLYMLNQEGGNVVRAWQSGRGYETDLTFRCGPLPNESLIVGPLIDIAIVPPTNYLDAQLMGMDANGILVYCLHDEPPIPVPLFPPDSNWGNPRAFALDNDILYVLDPQTNAVWVYYGENSEFSGRPRLFFDADVPPMSDVIDLAVDRGELYLLHEDGHITLCAFGFEVQPTRCTDPAPFTDSRASIESPTQSSPTLAGARFTEIAFTPPPDPSIYLLDPFQQAVYHLSLRLTLQRQYRPQIIEGPPRDTLPTTFILSPNRTVYLAFGNQVWVASLP